MTPAQWRVIDRYSRAQVRQNNAAYRLYVAYMAQWRALAPVNPSDNNAAAGRHG